MSVEISNIPLPFYKMNEPCIQHNAELADIFHQMASYYRYKGMDERFRAIAYDNASQTMTNLKENISQYAKDVKSFDQHNGIEESIAGRLKTTEFKNSLQELIEQIKTRERFYKESC